MPFDPKLIHADEPPLAAGGDLDLPAELAALGEQLSADAARLAAVYPPRQSAAISLGRSPASSRAWKYARYSAAGLVVAVTLGIAAVAWQPGKPLAHTPPAKTPAIAPAATSPVAAISPRPAEPSLSLTDLSGPELEAVLDMLADDSARDTSISF